MKAGLPLGGKIITDRATLRQIYEEGSGSIKVQGEWKSETQGRSSSSSSLSIPYGVEQDKLEGEIGAIIEARKLPQLYSVTNESNEKEGLRVTMEIASGPIRT